tara:strand:+ start:1 stop:1203 length:1203 start_codon:yes stop_codon:yes gene_type:complete
MYLQDNGGCAEGLGRAARGGMVSRLESPSLPAMKATDLQTKMIPDQTRDGFPTLMGPGVMPGPDGTYIAYGRGWANVSNTPFREYKHWVHEGGISTPLIAHWPKGIKGRGKLVEQPGHLIDLMATCVDLAGASYPQRIGENAIKPLEGRSLQPAFVGDKIERDAIYWEHEGNRAVRVGDWKLVAKGPEGAWELYNLRDDRTELHNVVKQEPEIAAQLMEKFEVYARRANVYPLVPYRNRTPKLSEQTVFNLKHGDVLTQNKAPNVVGRGFLVSAEVSKEFNRGVIVAQGGTAHGWSLFLNDGMLRVSVRIDGKLTVIQSPKQLPSQVNRIEMRYQKDGMLSIAVNSKHWLESKLPGPMRSMPLDPLEVAKDSNGIVGPYPSDYKANGQVKSLKIELEVQK